MKEKIKEKEHEKIINQAVNQFAEILVGLIDEKDLTKNETKSNILELNQ